MKVSRLKRFLDRYSKKYSENKSFVDQSRLHPLNQLTDFYLALNPDSQKHMELSTSQFYDLARICLGNNEFGFDHEIFIALRKKLRINTLKSILWNSILNYHFKYSDQFLLDYSVLFLRNDETGHPLNQTELQHLLRLEFLDPLLRVIYLVNRTTDISTNLTALISSPDYDALHEALHLLPGWGFENFPHLAIFLAHPFPKTMAQILLNIVRTVGEERWLKALCHNDPEKILLASDCLKAGSLNEDRDCVDAILQHKNPIVLAEAFCLLNRRNLLNGETREALIAHLHPGMLAGELCQRKGLLSKTNLFMPANQKPADAELKLKAMSGGGMQRQA